MRYLWAEVTEPKAPFNPCSTLSPMQEPWPELSLLPKVSYLTEQQEN